MSDNPFNFKQFSIYQDKCAMKIGTDAVLLGAWTSLKTNPKSILDIGAGTGVLSLMLAQRSNAQVIDAIEIADLAYEQCLENFENSKWSDRLFCYHASLIEFSEEINDQYDLIISNPPFYQDQYKSKDKNRDLARFTDAMPFEYLLKYGSQLLSNDGTFSVIIPFKETTNFIKLASRFNLLPKNITKVKGSPSSKFVRSLIELSFKDHVLLSKELIIETSRHQYTKEYIDLTKEFYLKM